MEWRRLCRYRPAGDAEIRLHRGGSVRHRQRQHQFLRALHQPHAGGRVARFRRSATGLGLREPHRPDRARARHRSGRVSPQESVARRPAAGERHRAAGRRHRRGARRAGRPHRLEQAVRSRLRHAAPRPRHRHRLQGLDLADHVGRDRQRLRRRQRLSLQEHGRYGAGLGHRLCADRRRSARREGGGRARRRSGYRRHALRHGHARLALAVSHGHRGAACGRGRPRQIARARHRGRATRRHQLSAGRNIQETLRHAGRQRHRHRELCAELQVARSADRAVGQRHAVLDGRRRRRRGRGRYRDRATCAFCG